MRPGEALVLSKSVQNHFHLVIDKPLMNLRGHPLLLCQNAVSQPYPTGTP